MAPQMHGRAAQVYDSLAQHFTRVKAANEEKRRKRGKGGKEDEEEEEAGGGGGGRIQTEFGRLEEGQESA